MYQPVDVPGESEEVLPSQLLTEIEGWVNSPPLRAVLSRFGAPSITGPLSRQLTELDDFVSRWDFRGENSERKERNQVALDLLNDEDERLVVEAATALGLVIPRTPRRSDYEHLVILGGLVRANVWRTAYAEYLVRTGVDVADVVALSAFRSLATNPDDPSRDEFALLDRFGLPRREFEWQVFEDVLGRVFGATLEERDASPLETPTNFRHRIASGFATDGRLLTLLVAPTSDPEGKRRADTAASYRYWADKVQHIRPGERVLVVTTTIYVPFQHCVALQHLSLPFGVRVETVGVNYDHIQSYMLEDAPPSFRGVHYLQEIRSTIRAYRRLVQQLVEQTTTPS